MLKCRFCFKDMSLDSSIHIFPNNQSCPTLPEIAAIFANIEVSETDPFSKYCCVTCHYLLITYYYHRLIIRSADRLFRMNHNNNRSTGTNDARNYQAGCSYNRIFEPQTILTIENRNLDFDNNGTTTTRIEDDREAALNQYTEIKGILCDVCGKRFRCQSVYKCHILSHSQNKSFKCHICYRAYKYNCNLNRHKRNCH